MKHNISQAMLGRDFMTSQLSFYNYLAVWKASIMFEEDISSHQAYPGRKYTGSADKMQSAKGAVKNRTWVLCVCSDCGFRRGQGHLGVKPEGVCTSVVFTPRVLHTAGMTQRVSLVFEAWLVSLNWHQPHFKSFPQEQNPEPIQWKTNFIGM